MTRNDRRRIVVAGAGGFIGGHLVRALLEQRDAEITAVDCKPFAAWYQRHDGADNVQRDLAEKSACYELLEEAREVYNLAADMGGMGFIEHNKALCMLSVLINTHLLLAARDLGVQRFFFASSACVYAAGKQDTPYVTPLREQDAYPAMPEDGYGWEKLFGERMCHHFLEDFGLETRVARYHNVYGPHGTWTGGREKAPAAICRKVAEAKLSGSHAIEVWGDGKQTRSFTYIDDGIEGTLRLAQSNVSEPLNIGSDQLVTVDELIDIVEEIAGIRVDRRYKLDAPLGVRGRNSDNTMIRDRLGWAPSTALEDGLQRTYRWIYDQLTGPSSPSPTVGHASSHPIMFASPRDGG
jgi:GDP-D-mannose 3', 5'-epimerase